MFTFWQFVDPSMQYNLNKLFYVYFMFVLILLFCRKTKYLEVTLYHSYYAFESLFHRSPAELVCGVCGATPDILFGK